MHLHTSPLVVLFLICKKIFFTAILYHISVCHISHVGVWLMRCDNAKYYYAGGGGGDGIEDASGTKN